MAVQPPYLQTDGDINQAKRKRAGESLAIDAVPKQTSFDVTNTPAARVQPGSVPGNPARAAQMQAQFNQPVSKGSSPLLAVQPAVGGGGGDQRPAIAGDSAGLQRMIGGSLSIVPAAIWEGAKNLGTDLQNTAYSLIDAEPVPRPGYPRTTQLAQEIAGGASAFSDANSNLLSSAKGGARDLLGAKPTQPSDGGSAAAAPVSPPKPTDKPGSTNKPSAAAQAAPVVAPNAPAASEYTQTGTDGIVMRVGKNGVPEFTNETATPGAASGAQPPKAGYGTTRPTQSSAPGNMTAPSGARVLASGSHTPDTEFAALGSAANLGNGVGGFSQNTAGSAALALERFGRANEIRAGTQRPRELGDNGGRLTVVRDSSRAPTMADLQNAKLDARQAQTADIRERTAQSSQQQQRESMNSEVDRQLRSLEAAQAQLGLADRQRLSELQQAILDPSLSTEDRRVLADQYRVLSGNKAENRFTVVPGGQAINAQGVAYTLPSTVINNQTGEFVQQGNAGQAFRTSVSRDEVAQTARSRGISEEEVIQALKAKGVSVNG